MPRIVLVTCLIVISYLPLSGQTLRDVMSISLYPSLDKLHNNAYAAAKSNNELEQAARTKVATLLGLSYPPRTFGQHPYSYYLTQYGQDTGRQVVELAKAWDLHRRRRLRWKSALARIRHLRTQKGTSELTQRYGDKLVELLKTPKSAQNLINKEVMRGVVFFHEWLTETHPSPIPTMLLSQDQYYVPIDKIRKEVVRLNSRLPIPEPQPTITAGGTIPADDILFSYPLNGQANFYLFDFLGRHGAIQLRKGPEGNELYNASQNGLLWARWESAKGKVLYTRAALIDINRIYYTIPTYFLQTTELYELRIVKADTEIFDKELDFYAKKDLKTVVEQNVFHRAKKSERVAATYFTAYFRVSKYGSAESKWKTYKVANEAVGSNALALRFDEAFGQEEIDGIHGIGGILSLRSNPCRAASDRLKRVYGSGINTFFAHPNQDYLEYLERNRDKLNVDSLVAIEFLPLSERRKHYRKLRYTNANGRSRSTRGASPLPSEPRPGDLKLRSANTQVITKATFNNPADYQLQEGIITIEDPYYAEIDNILTIFREKVNQRAVTYADVLKKLNDLAPQVAEDTDFLELVKEYNHKFIINQLNNQQPISIKQCPLEKLNIEYFFPLKSFNTLGRNLEVVKSN